MKHLNIQKTKRSSPKARVILSQGLVDILKNVISLEYKGFGDWLMKIGALVIVLLCVAFFIASTVLAVKWL